jgi:hypothetical protein
MATLQKDIRIYLTFGLHTPTRFLTASGYNVFRYSELILASVWSLLVEASNCYRIKLNRVESENKSHGYELHVVSTLARIGKEDWAIPGL